MGTVKILAFPGSSREGSLNKKLIGLAANACEKAGATLTLIDLKDYALPIYDGDIEAKSGLPENAKRLKQLAKTHAAFLIASPEYNGSFSPLLKNAIDWMSRQEAGEQSLEAFQGKAAALLSASPGKLGGLRGLVHLRALLGNVGVLVIPEQVAVPQADKALGFPGQPVDADQLKAVEKLCGNFVKILEKLAG